MSEKKSFKEFLAEAVNEIVGKSLPAIEESTKNLVHYIRTNIEEKLERFTRRLKEEDKDDPPK